MISSTDLRSRVITSPAIHTSAPATDEIPAELAAYLSRQLQLPADLATLRTKYQSARPFSHLVIDDLFPARLLDRVRDEVPRLKAEQLLNVENEGREKIVRMRSAMELEAAGNELTALLHSAGFLYLLSEITGIWQLLPDPYLQGGGHALMHRDGYFKVHSDRNVAYETGLTRRLAMIIFLNRDWPGSYGGQLELWNADATRCEASIEPVFNKTVIFEVAYPNFHGVPKPLACPPDRIRQSFLVYYHTAGGPQQASPHSTLFAPGFYRKKNSRFRDVAGQLVPPILARALRKLTR
jgi:Rps23 Pro-64 3,4-dihydroxylase Tpa1-like proline 4-hydroxylase